jgi:RHS repeat-associated protein
VQIIETVASTVSSTKQFVSSDGAMREARNSAGTIVAQYFSLGETISAADYLYTCTREGSVREMTDSAGNIQAQYSYDAYGRMSKLSGSLAADFQFANYYYHAPSGLSLAVNRTYRAAFGRWINRDPIGEPGGLNLYDYVNNRPIDSTDPLGLAPFVEPPFSAPDPILTTPGLWGGNGYGWGYNPFSDVPILTPISRPNPNYPFDPVVPNPWDPTAPYNPFNSAPTYPWWYKSPPLGGSRPIQDGPGYPPNMNNPSCPYHLLPGSRNNPFHQPAGYPGMPRV